MKELKFITRTHVLQQREYSSGLACLTSIAKYHEGEIRHEQLRNLSGTTPLGTTVLGLYQAANKIGFHAEGYKSTIEDLKSIEAPVVLDVTMDNKLKHFLVCYGFDGQFLIGDPACGIMQYSIGELNAVWKTKTLLKLTPNDHFLKTKSKISQKREWIKQLLKEDVYCLSVIVVLDISLAFSGLVPAVFVQKLTDNIFPAQDSSEFLFSLALLGAAMMLRTGLIYIKEIVLALQTKNFNTRISAGWVKKFFGLPKSFFEDFTAEKLIAHRNDNQRIHHVISFLIRNVLLHALIVLVFAGFIFTYSVLLAVSTLISISIYGLFAFRYNKKIDALQMECAALGIKSQSNYVSNQQMISIIKDFNKEKSFSKIARNIDTLLQEKIFGLGLLLNQKKFFQNVLGAVCITSTMAITYSMGMNYSLALGELLAFFILLTSIISSSHKLVLSGIKIQEATNAFNRMFEFANIETEHEIKVSKHESIQNSDDFSLEVKNISFRFTGNRALFKNVSFSVRPGELITIFGESGSGKSSVFKILQRLNDFESGEIIFNQKDWKEIDNYSWRKKIAIVPQNIKLLNSTLIENICFDNLNEDAIKVIEFCRKYRFDKYFESLPQGYLTLVGEDGIKVSGGQKQLIALARALYKQPQLLLLDETLNSMDKKMEAFTIALLKEIKEKTAVILVTNRVQATSQSDFIYVLDKGEMSLSGKHEQLITYKNIYSESFEELTANA